MDKLKKALFWDRDKFPGTYSGELDYQSNLVVFPASLICIFAWMSYIKTDSIIYPDKHIIIYARYGLTIFSSAVFIMQFIPFFKKKSMLLLAALGLYLEAATGTLTGATGGDPVYVAGYFFVLILIIVAPINRFILWLLVAVSMSAFLITGTANGLSFVTEKQKYTMNDMILVTLFSSIFIYVLDRMRYTNWRKSSQLKQQSDELAKEKDTITGIINEARALIENMTESTATLRDFSADIDRSVLEQSPIVSKTMDSSAMVIESFNTINASTSAQNGFNEKGKA